MKASEIRKRFTNFFKEHGHEKIASSSLVPHDDPTLLFANAGMNQFKDYFTGKAKPKNPRATTIQKCVRAGGKHNDLENVGFTARHHTFFEMMGNFSFGDYFKSEAIDFAWKLLTIELKIPKDKLYITVHESDQEAFDIWHNEQGIAKDRIFYMGDKDNFWEMGDTGPCGPCSEIFYDHGEEYSDGADTSKCLLNDEGRYVEIWNLVFMQFEKKLVDGKIIRENLPKPSVDTGAGLERIAAVMQGKYFNYDTDVFTDIMEAIENISNKSYGDKKFQPSFRVIADHIRSSSMLISDGVIPSNEGRGYVLRRIIRRAIRHLEELGVSETAFYKLAKPTLKTLKEEYPENYKNLELVEKLLKLEEEKFRTTLSTGLTLINKEIKNLKGGKTFPGEIAFKLYDTYGFPVDLTQTILQDKKIDLDMNAFDKAMSEQKEQSKQGSKFNIKEDNLKFFYDLKDKFGATHFTGYTKTKDEGKLLSISDDGLVFDQTPFYAESGGQVGDTGEIYLKDELVAYVVDTQKVVDAIHVHIVEPIKTLKEGQKYKLVINNKRREQIKKNHSATHLLQAALIQTLGGHVKQAGSLVTEEKLRFDFTHTSSVKKEELTKIENLVNEVIADANDVEAEVMSKDAATKKGAMALFGEKYGKEVRVLSMGDFSIELCGGTHVHNTSDIGFFVILSESSLSSGIRRIEALTGANALNYLKKRSEDLKALEQFLGVASENVLEKIQNQINENKKQNKEIQLLKDKIQSLSSKSLFDNKKDLSNGLSMVITEAKDIAVKDFRSLSDKFVDQEPKGILVLYKVESDKMSVLVRTNKKNSYPCGAILKETLASLNGSGGGRPDMAQGSAPADNKEQVLMAIEERLSSL